jgi:hypothetical protein
MFLRRRRCTEVQVIVERDGPPENYRVSEMQEANRRFAGSFEQRAKSPMGLLSVVWKRSTFR